MDQSFFINNAQELIICWPRWREQFAEKYLVFADKVIDECGIKQFSKQISLNGFKFIKLLLDLIDYIFFFIPADAVCKEFDVEKVHWIDFYVALAHYWTHVCIFQRNYMKILILRPLSCISDEVYGRSPGCIISTVQSSVANVWRSCSVSRLFRMEQLLERCCEFVGRAIPLQIKRLICCKFLIKDHVLEMKLFDLNIK